MCGEIGENREQNGDSTDSNATHRAQNVDQPLAEALGIEIRYEADELAPPVDKDRIRAFDRRELPEPERSDVLKLISTFRCWHEAWGEVRREETPD